MTVFGKVFKFGPKLCILINIGSLSLLQSLEIFNFHREKLKILALVIILFRMPPGVTTPSDSSYAIEFLLTSLFSIIICDFLLIFITASLDPVLIIGSGLSAADAVLICDRFSLSVLHIFKSYSFLNENKFSKTMYPEYNHVYNLMKNNEQSSDYKALSQYSVLEICLSDKGRRVLVQSPSGFISWYKVTYIAVLTGYLPNLKFLPSEFDNGRTLGVCYLLLK